MGSASATGIVAAIDPTQDVGTVYKIRLVKFADRATRDAVKQLLEGQTVHSEDGKLEITMYRKDALHGELTIRNPAKHVTHKAIIDVEVRTDPDINAEHGVAFPIPDVFKNTVTDTKQEWHLYNCSIVLRVVRVS